MTSLTRTLHRILMEQSKTIFCASKFQRFDSSDTIRYRQRGLATKSKPKKFIKERPRWVIKMHKLLLSDVSLPFPAQEPAKFDTSHLQSCSVDDLLSLVWTVSRIDRQTNPLLVELWRRMDVMSVEQIICVADIFFINKVNSLWYLGAMMFHVVEKMDVMELTPSQLTRLTLHTLDQRISSVPGFYLVLEDFVLRSIDSLSMNQLAVICYFFFTSQTRIRSMNLLDRISMKVLHEFDSLNIWYLPAFMKTMRFSNFIKISFYKDLGDLLIKKDYLESFYSVGQIMHIAHAYASVRISHPALFSYILQTCCHPRYKFRLKDFSKLIWACGTLVTDKSEDIAAIKKILTYVENNLSLEEAKNHPDNLVDLISGLCILNIHSNYLLNKLFHPQYVKAVMGLGTGHEKIPQLDIIDHWVDIEHPEYTGHRLSQKFKETIKHNLGSFPKEKEMTLKKGLKQAIEALVCLIGQNEVSCVQVLPHFHSSDIFLVWDCLKSQFVSHDIVGLSSGQETGQYTRLAVQILSNMQTSYDGKPLGMLCMKLRQLKMLGYTPVLIDAEDASHFVYDDIQTTQEFLRDKLSLTLCTDLIHLLPIHQTPQVVDSDDSVNKLC